ncbi:MAG: UDP-3-O-acyl-N-acetylglucosamine deacetylase [Sphingobacteriia bacterium]|nr:UDP-3-O-acyl-N-acetylglucosamine deacetylase [Sphingobacteriia bacterium]
MNHYQQTIAHKVSCFGQGVHSGVQVHLNILPADENFGIKFIRTDLSENNIIEAKYSNVSNTQLCTVLANEHGVSVSTVEHLMAALWGCGIDNAKIEVNNQELPIMDGSSEPFVFLIESAGIVTQNAKRKIIEITKEVTVKEGNAYITLIPSETFEVELSIDFPDTKVIGKQAYYLDAGDSSFKNDISRARTFGFAHEVEYLRKIGLAKGGSLENAIVVNGDEILNQDGLRFKDEFVRHKVLDCIGDVYLAGGYIKGKVQAYCSGHKLNNMLLRKLFSMENAWREAA